MFDNLLFWVRFLNFIVLRRNYDINIIEILRLSYVIYSIRQYNPLGYYLTKSSYKKKKESGDEL